MNTTNLDLSLRDMAISVTKKKNYWKVKFELSQGDSRDGKEATQWLIAKKDFTILGQRQFTFDEALEIQEAGRKYHLRLMHAFEWRGFGMWVTYGDRYFGLSKFDFAHEGHTWEGTDIPQTQDGGSYYWTGSDGSYYWSDDGSVTSSYRKENACAVRCLPSGYFDILFRPRKEKMNVRLVYDENWK